MANPSVQDEMSYPHADRRAKPKGLTFDKTVNVSSVLAIIGLITTMMAGIITASKQSQKMDDWKMAQDLATAKQNAQIEKLVDVQIQTEKNAAVLNQIVQDLKEQRKP